jgi:hypothetical protein
VFRIAVQDVFKIIFIFKNILKYFFYFGYKYIKKPLFSFIFKKKLKTQEAILNTKK